MLLFGFIQLFLPSRKHFLRHAAHATPAEQVAREVAEAGLVKSLGEDVLAGLAGLC